MTVLVTGAGGMVGSHMIERLISQGESVIGTYYKPTIDIKEIWECGARLVECDVRYPQSVERVIRKYKPDKIFHLAAQSYPTVSWIRPYETIDTNINGTIAIFEAVKHIKLDDTKYDPIVVVACSSAEYGQSLNDLEGEEVFVKETTELKPLHPYGVSKVGQDLISFQYFINDNIKCIRARIFNSTGTRKINDVTSDFTKRAILAERDGTYRIKVGNLDTRRAIMDQRDLVTALLLLSEHGIPGEVYNISSERIYVMKDIIAYIEKYINHTLEIIVDKSLLRPTDEIVIAGDVSKLKRDTNWKQDITMEQTIADMLEYWRKVLPNDNVR